MERAMGFEPTTFCLGSKHSTTELRPLRVGCRLRGKFRHDSTAAAIGSTTIWRGSVNGWSHMSDHNKPSRRKSYSVQRVPLSTLCKVPSGKVSDDDVSVQLGNLAGFDHVFNIRLRRIDKRGERFIPCIAPGCTAGELIDPGAPAPVFIPLDPSLKCSHGTKPFGARYDPIVSLRNRLTPPLLPPRGLTPGSPASAGPAGRRCSPPRWWHPL